MSVVEDVRKVIQDLVAPELQGLRAKIDGLEKTIEAKFSSVDAKLEVVHQKLTNSERETNLRMQSGEERSSARNEVVLARLETFAAKINAKFDAVEKKADLDKTEILNALQTEKRIKSLEDQVFLHSQAGLLPLGGKSDEIMTRHVGITKAAKKPRTSAS